MPNYKVIDESREKSVLIEATGNKMIGWVPLTDEGKIPEEKVVYGVINKTGVPLHIYERSGKKVTNRKSQYSAVKFDNIGLDDEGDVIIKQDGSSYKVDKYQPERIDIPHKKLLLQQKTIEAIGIKTEGKPFYMTPYSMQVQIDKHYEELKKEKENEKENKSMER